MLGSPVLLSGKPSSSTRRSPRDPPADQKQHTPTPLDLAVVFEAGQDANVVRFSRPRQPTLDITNHPTPLDDEYIARALAIQTPEDFDVRLLPSNGISPKSYIRVTKRKSDDSDLMSKVNNRLEILERNDAEKSEKIAEQGKKIAEQSERIAEQGEKIAEQSERMAEQGEKIAEQEEKIAEQGEKIESLTEELTGIHAVLAGNQVAADLIKYCDNYLCQNHTGANDLCQLLKTKFPGNSFLHDFTSIILNVAVCNLYRSDSKPLVIPAVLPEIPDKSQCHLKNCIKKDSTVVRNLESLEQATLNKIKSAIEQCSPHAHIIACAVALRIIKLHNGTIRNEKAHPDAFSQKHIVAFLLHYQSEGYLTTTMGREAARMALAKWPALNREAFALFLG